MVSAGLIPIVGMGNDKRGESMYPDASGTARDLSLPEPLKS